MPVTDLTGTTWVFNNGLKSPSADFLYSLNFISNNITYAKIQTNGFSGPAPVRDLRYNDTNVYVYNSKGWINEAYKTISITGGTDATNTALISWLEANATQQAVSTKLSVDLITLSGWSNLAPGNHTIKIVAKGTGYRDSEKSAGVEVTKPAAAYTDCLTFTGESSEFTLKATNKEWDDTLQWSTDHNTWTTLTGTEAMQSADRKLYLRGSGNTKFYTTLGVRWILSAKAGCSGNIQTLLDWENPPTSIPSDNCYCSMFEDCANLTTAPDLPATTLAINCYWFMFRGCSSLVQAPELPATTLANSCYNNMFRDCSSLVQAPELPATTLANVCYRSMFQGCSSLVQAPELPSTTLADSCYRSMFQGCTKLKVNASSGNKIFTCPSTIPTDAVTSMFTNTGGTFTGTPTAGNTYYWTE